MTVNFNDFLVVSAMIALISLVAFAFLRYQSEKQLRESRNRTNRK